MTIFGNKTSTFLFKLYLCYVSIKNIYHIRFYGKIDFRFSKIFNKAKNLDFSLKYTDFAKIAQKVVNLSYFGICIGHL